MAVDGWRDKINPEREINSSIVKNKINKPRRKWSIKIRGELRKKSKKNRRKMAEKRKEKGEKEKNS